MASSLALKSVVSSNILPISMSLIRPVAVSLALKGFVSSNILTISTRVIRPMAAVTPSASRLFNTAVAPSASRLFNTAVAPSTSRLSNTNTTRLFSNYVFYDFEVLKMMDPLRSNPFKYTKGGVPGMRRNWKANATNDAWKFRIDMPGLERENVKIRVDKKALIIEGESPKRPKESEDDERVERYTSKIELLGDDYKMNMIKAEMKSGVLNMVVPKYKAGEMNERDLNFHVQID